MKEFNNIGSTLFLCSVTALASWSVGSEPKSAANNSAAIDFHQLLADEWDARLREDPLFASSVDNHKYDNRLPDNTADDFKRRIEQDVKLLERLGSLDHTMLSEADQLNYDLIEFILKQRVKLARYDSYRIPFLSDSGFYIDVQRMYESMPFNTATDYDNYLARMNAFGKYFDQHIANMRQGLEDGFTQPREILDEIVQSIAGPIVDGAEQSIFFTPFKNISSHIAITKQDAIRIAGKKSIETVVIPAYRNLLQFFKDEYIANARTTLGASKLPDGDAYYRDLVHYFTSLDNSTADDIYATGLVEVARIRTEMEAIIEKVKFKGSFADFLEFLRTDSQFYVTEPQQLLKEAAYIAKQVDGQMPAFFRTLPRMPYGVQPVPADIAPNYTTGRYWDAPIGGSRGGYYMVNTYALDKRPLYTLPALTVHEAVPGHHHQTALVQEIQNVPKFRQVFSTHAFSEGWGLYCEKLAIEMGIYDTPYKEFGRLTYEMWRAVRLVVDTGIHTRGWTRKQAQNYLAENTALSLHNVRTEVDRYIAWPGQALAYKTGELKILELRKRAERVLGARFDIRDFHDAVLLSGGIPLSILEKQIDKFIARTLVVDQL